MRSCHCRPAQLLFVVLLIPSAARAQCTGSIDLGPDVTLCQGQTVLLTPGPGFLSYLWSGGSTAASRTVGNAGTYFCTVSELAVGGDLVVNGDFSAGATGFTSGYIPGTGGTYGLLSNEGQYAVASDPSDTHNNFPPCADHTGGGGNMLVVNGSATPGVSIWCQTIAVAPGTDYAFTAWLSTVVSENPAELQFTINGQLLGNAFQAAILSCSWNQFYEVWSSGSNTTAEICITNQNTQSSGNDFALDDISFRPFCSYSDTVEVFVNPYPQPDLGADQFICGDGSVTLDASAANAAAYTWSDGLTTDDQLEVSTSGTYWVEAANGACARRDSVEVSFLPQPSVDLGPDRVLCPGDSVTLLAGAQGPTYLWHDASTDNTWTGWATEEAWVLITQGPCTATDTVQLSVQTCQTEVRMPNVFTPNGDPHNNQFKPLALDGVASLELTIYNRWGQKVYGTKALQFAWDGRTQAGEEVPDGVYYWVLTYTGAKGEDEMNGVVTLLR